MTKSTALLPKERQMLELLAEGASTRILARKMGYSEGTVRVYLHNVYRRLGVKNRTEAVLWQLRREPPPAPAPAAAPGARVVMEESFGDAALRDGALGALGIMESFLGPYGRVWEAGLRLRDGGLDDRSLARRDLVRPLWRALLAGDFERAKRAYESGLGAMLLAEQPSDAVLLALMLQVGGFSHAAEQLVAEIARKRKAGRSISARDAELLAAMRGVLYRRDEEALGALHHLAAEGRGNAAFRHLAMAALYYAYRAWKDDERAKATADALWAEAEAARGQLEAMGVKPLGREASLPRPPRPAPRPPQVREKVAVER